MQSTLGTDQHYVPQALLRGFTFNDKEQVHVFDKMEGRIFSPGIRNIACERDFYTNNGSAALDAAMNTADDAVAPILLEVRQRERIHWLSPKEHSLLVGFVTLQLIRTRGAQEDRFDTFQQIAEQLNQKGGERLVSDWRAGFTREKNREEFLRSIPTSTKQFMPHLLNKTMMLFKSDGSLPFWTSDNPVVMNNTMNPGDGFVGTLGLAVKGIEVYLPISSSLIISFLCSSISNANREIDEHCRRLGFINQRAHSWLVAERMGRPRLLNRENIRFQNSLQVLNAKRFIISSVKQFDDANEMFAKDDATNRTGSRVVVR